MEEKKVIIDLNKITRQEFNKLRMGLKDSDLEKREQATAETIAKVVLEWPFDNPISVEGFLNLGLKDSKFVEDAVTAAIDDLAKKN